MLQIYPVGFRCERMCPNVTTADFHESCYVFEIKEVEGGPEFNITNKNSGQTHWASTEAGAFKKLEGIR